MTEKQKGRHNFWREKCKQISENGPKTKNLTFFWKIGNFFYPGGPYLGRQHGPASALYAPAKSVYKFSD